MKSRSSRSFASWHRLLLAVLLALGGSLAYAAPAAAVPYVDRRVTAIPATTLLHAPISHLVDARRQRVSEHLRRWTRPLYLVWAFAQIGAFAYLWLSGAGARLRDWVRKRVRNEHATRFAYGGLMALCSAVAAFPFAFVRYRFDYNFGLTPEVASTWFRDGFLNALIHAALLGIIVAGILALVDRTRLWYLWAMAGLFVATLIMAFLEPVVVAPLYNRFERLPATAPARAPIDALAAKAGVAGAPIEISNESRRSQAAIADIAGVGPTKRIVLSDTLLANATLPEILFLTARELGHYAHGDDFRLSLFWTFLLIACTALAVVCADRVGFRRDDDPLSRLPLVFAFLGLLALIATPLYNGYSRGLEARADAYALKLTGDRVAAARAFVRLADETLAPLCSSRPIVIYFFNSPPLGSRIATATGREDPCR